MTASALMPPRFVTPSSVLRKVAGNDEGCIDCQVTRKILAACDGQRSLRDIAQAMLVPMTTCLSVVEKALTRQWLEFHRAPALPSERQARFIQDVEHRLHTTLGAEQGKQVLDAAQRLIASHGEGLTAKDVQHLLIALELVADEPQRQALQPQLDELQSLYC